MPISDTTRQTCLSLRYANDSLIKKYQKEKAEHDAASAALAVKIQSLQGINEKLMKDIPAPELKSAEGLP